MFNQNDLYLASGTAELANHWVNPVYKFDSSSFYNWEQDNLPIYDLEDRDNYLYEMAGFPASSIDGVMLTVSDCGIDNKKVYGSVSAAIDALPNTIRFPVIIEVCLSGSLGELVVENKEFRGEGAGLEIINRGFGKVMSGSGAVEPVSSAVMTTETGSSDGSAIRTFSSVDLSNTLYNSKSLGVSSTVWIDNPESVNWWNNFTRAFVQTPEWSNADTVSTKTTNVSVKFSDTLGDFLSNGVANTFNVVEYEDNTMDDWDLQVINEAADTPVYRPFIDLMVGPNKTRTVGFVYANALSRAVVRNCTGNVFIRGFCVDGGDKALLTVDGVQRTKYGFEIENSEVVIENCTATRCTHTGLRAHNSNVTLNRGFMAYRNYEMVSRGVGYLNDRIPTVVSQGLHAVNSNVTLSASIFQDIGLPVDSPFSFCRNAVGVELENSTLNTPKDAWHKFNMEGVSNGDANMGEETIVLQTFQNSEVGLLGKSSVISTGKRISSFENKVGISLDGCTLEATELCVDHNQERGLATKNSSVTYHYNNQAFTETGPFYPITNFFMNGQHAYLDSSQFMPTLVSGMDKIFDRLEFSGTFGIEERISNGTTKQSLPSVVVDNGSYLQAVACKNTNITSKTNSTSFLTAQGFGVRGSEFQVTNGSKLDLIGIGDDATFVTGPQNWKKQQRVCSIYAGEGSYIHISGPTAITQTGVGVLAEDNSTVEISPQTYNGVLDASSWSLNDVDNHTQVNLHTTRASLVANRNSVINMHDLGDYNKFWGAANFSNETVDYPTGLASYGGYQISSLTYNGSMQFYPNPYIRFDEVVGSRQTELIAASTYPSVSLFVADAATRALPSFPDTQPDVAAGGVSALSMGGMCVRAVDDSQVQARNVVFPCGWVNTSGPYYDLQTIGNCDHLRIWNIADQSELHASYLTVGNEANGLGAYPGDRTDYYGPSAVWASSAGWPEYGGLSGAPSSTPDTSSLSILDSFGKGTDTSGLAGYYGKTSHENKGPFRIYVSPHPKAKFLGYPIDENGTAFPGGGIYPTDVFKSMGWWAQTATLKTGAPYQLFAQGYSTSGDCSASPPSTVSAIYEDLGFSGWIESKPMMADGHAAASSFFYTSAMLPNDSETKIWLDDSAMNTFANAKNGTLNTSGRKKIFSYYKAINVYPGEGFWNTTVGQGFRSANLFDLDREL